MLKIQTALCIFWRTRLGLLIFERPIWVRIFWKTHLGSYFLEDPNGSSYFFQNTYLNGVKIKIKRKDVIWQRLHHIQNP